MEKKPIDTRYQSKHETLEAAQRVAQDESKKKPENAFGIIEDCRAHIYYVEEDYTFIRNFERFHGEYLDGKFLKPDKVE